LISDKRDTGQHRRVFNFEIRVVKQYEQDYSESKPGGNTSQSMEHFSPLVEFSKNDIRKESK
jgi:hypothetical protein